MMGIGPEDEMVQALSNDESSPGQLSFQKRAKSDEGTSDKELAFVNKVYVINLERRPDRWERFKEHASAILSLPPEAFTRVEAIDGDLLDPTDEILLRIFNLSDWR